MVDYRDRLQEAMKRAGMTTTTLSKALGVSYQAIKKVLDGKSKSLTAENNALAAAKLGVSPDWLATGSETLTVNYDKELQQAIAAAPLPSLTPGALIAQASRDLLRLSAADREAVSQLAALMLRNGPSESLASAIDEVAAKLQLEPVIPIQKPKAARLVEELTTTMAALPEAERRDRLRQIAGVLGLAQPEATDREPAGGHHKDATPTLSRQ